MLIHEALERHLSQYVTEVNSRVYAEMAPSKTPTPFITYTRVGTQYHHQFGRDSGFNTSHIQVDVYAVTAKEAQAIAVTMRKAVIDFSGIMGGDGGVYIGSVILEDESDGFDSDTHFFRVTQEYRITFCEEV